MSTRVSLTERIRAQIDKLFASDQDLGEVLRKSPGLECTWSCRAPSKPRSPVLGP